MLLSASGYVVATEVIRSDRDAAATRRAQVQRVQVLGLLERARAYVVGLDNALAGEPLPQQRRFAQLEGSTAGGVGLADALWVQRVPASARPAYERRLGGPITWLTPSGRFERAPAAASYLPATFTSTTRRELRRGVDVSGWPALAAAIRDRASVFAVSATRPGSLGGQAGFFLLETSRFGRGAGSRGFLIVFVPSGWLTLSLGVDPRRIAISLDGRRLEGQLDSAPGAGRSFAALAGRWRVDVGNEPAPALQSAVPWLASAWPSAAALIAFFLLRGIRRRRRAERRVERIFDLSLDLVSIAGLDGYFKQVNPAFERVLGYSSQEILSRPFLDLVHPDDRERTRDVVARLARGQKAFQFENRYICRDGSERWLQWSTTPVLGEGLLYAVARDVTDRRAADDELRDAHRMIQASHDELRALADEQAALRRVATLVARRVSATEVFDAVAAEMGRLLRSDATWLLRYEPDGTATVVAAHGTADVQVPVGMRQTFEGETLPALIRRTGRASRIDGFEGAADSLARLRELGLGSAVGGPILVEGRLWGVMIAAWPQPGAVAANAEARMAQFTELTATAIANAESRAELTASRARVVAASDETRRRIERDLHDGTQQRLVSLALSLRAAEAKVPPQLDELRRELSQTASELAGAVEDLQEISRGIHPAILSRGGIGPVLKTLARRSAVPVQLDVRVDRRLPERIEAAAYYVVSEALTNTAKHARASVVDVDVKVDGSALDLAIRDDGAGGADPARGSGLIGLRDRVEALEGTMEIFSSASTGTSLLVRIPLDDPAAAIRSPADVSGRR
ncbi:MAG: hypothetical protein JWO02_1792 [Solirubrobacterales bacterium]|nr:hypothetical protein [Solirubrobacterales bacterium]